MLLDWIVFDCFDSFLAQLNVSFELSIFLKMVLMVIWDRSENKDEFESKQKRRLRYAPTNIKFMTLYLHIRTIVHV